MQRIVFISHAGRIPALMCEWDLPVVFLSTDLARCERECAASGCVCVASNNRFFIHEVLANVMVRPTT